MAANKPLTSKMEFAPGAAASVPPQPLLRLLGLATLKPVGKVSEKARLC